MPRSGWRRCWRWPKIAGRRPAGRRDLHVLSQPMPSSRPLAARRRDCAAAARHDRVLAAVACGRSTTQWPTQRTTGVGDRRRALRPRRRRWQTSAGAARSTCRLPQPRCCRARSSPASTEAGRRTRPVTLDDDAEQAAARAAARQTRRRRRQSQLVSAGHAAGAARRLRSTPPRSRSRSWHTARDDDKPTTTARRRPPRGS